LFLSRTQNLLKLPLGMVGGIRALKREDEKAYTENYLSRNE
jgi:hypothetical protein